ncbi:MAG: hypothetical protein KKI09_10205 [Spirochaetes bacterium]|nr:hypothetical protein [Spirochaetota bacterium]MBU0955789.1 hypothetical protein [Spirochaetota bacterium]
MLTVGIFGRGRLGQVLATAIEAEPDLTLAWSVGTAEHEYSPVDVALDASSSEAVASHVHWCMQRNIPLIVAATGWPQDLLQTWFSSTDNTAASGALMIAPNLSLSMAFMRRMALLFGRFAYRLGAELAIHERHHSGKKDIPSGTALLLADALRSGNPDICGWTRAVPEKSKIHISSSRLGFCLGLHELMLQTTDETIMISHQVESRNVFAKGAVLAIKWLHGKKGFYTFDDCVAANFVDLFDSQGDDR